MSTTGSAPRSPRRPPARRRASRPPRSAVGARRVDDRAVGERVGERHAELDQVGPGVRVRRRRPLDPSIVGKPPMRYGMSARAPGPRAAANAARAMRRSAVESLGRQRARAPPRGPCRRGPSRQTRSIVEPARRPREHRVVQRVRGLERRDDPLEPGAPLERGERLVVGHRDVARAAGVAQPRVLGADARVVEAGRDRVRLEDLAVVVLQDALRARRAARRRARRR